MKGQRVLAECTEALQDCQIRAELAGVRCSPRVSGSSVTHTHTHTHEQRAGEAGLLFRDIDETLDEVERPVPARAEAFNRSNVQVNKQTDVLWMAGSDDERVCKC